MKGKKITTLFLDIGGVLLTNGWDTDARHRAAKHFKIDEQELNERHKQTFDTYESGRINLDEYLHNILFYQKRDFSKKEFKAFMLKQSQMLPDSGLQFFKELKAKHQLKVVALSNEARELNEYRIEKFKLNELFDMFISSCYVHLRKPDPEIFKMALDIANTLPQHGLFVDDRALFVDVARSLGLNTLHYTGVKDAKAHIKKMNF